MDRETLKADLLLLLTAAIWGFAFVAQRAGMDFIGPFLFNGIRFALGAMVLIPFVIAERKRTGQHGLPLREGIMAGLVLFAGASLQQIGLVYTTAGNAGFITGLYVILVPVLGLLMRESTHWRTWTAGILATGGMFLLTTSGTARMTTGDMFVLAGALFWAVHIQLISKFMKRSPAIQLAAVQFVICSVLSLLASLLLEPIYIDGIGKAVIPILYGGLISVGIAYTLQVVAQKKAPPSHAAIIMSLETVFAMIGGWMVLGERVSVRGAVGGLLMLTAMMLSAYGSYRSREASGL